VLLLLTVISFNEVCVCTRLFTRHNAPKSSYCTSCYISPRVAKHYFRCAMLTFLRRLLTTECRVLYSALTSYSVTNSLYYFVLYFWWLSCSFSFSGFVLLFGTVGSSFTTGLRSRIFGCKSNCRKRVLFKWFKLR